MANRNNHKRIFSALVLFTGVFLALSQAPASAEELDIVNRPVNTSGLTGLLFTTAPYTLAQGTVEIGVSILNEDSDIPNFSITEFPLSISVGLPKNSELALRGSYFQVKKGPAGAEETDRKTGDLDLLYKWNFMAQPEDSIRPAVSLIAAGIVPTDNNTDMKISSVSHWGMRLGLSAGTEISWKDHILGIYADAQVQGQDLDKPSIRDIYEVFNAGLLYPVSKYRNLQMFVEYTQVYGKDRITLSGGDYYGFTYGIRLVSERFNLTIGTQFLHKRPEGYENTSRLIGLMSMKL